MLAGRGYLQVLSAYSVIATHHNTFIWRRPWFSLLCSIVSLVSGHKILCVLRLNMQRRTCTPTLLQQCCGSSKLP